MKLLLLFLLSLMSFLLNAKECNLSSPLKSFHPKYAHHFFIDYYVNFKVIHVDVEKYYLITGQIDCTFKGVTIKTPVKHVAMMSTTYLPALELLNMEKSLNAFQGKDYIVSKKFDLGKLQEISYKFNPEDLLKLNSDLIMGYSSNLSTPHQKKILESLNLPVVINKDFEETRPLARAEWLIFISSFYNSEEKAINIFSTIENQYVNLTRENTKLSKSQVIVGDIQGGVWVTCGGTSDLAQLIIDAGGELAFAVQSPQTQRISLEKIALAKKYYDIWLTHNMWDSKEEKKRAVQKDSRYNFINAKEAFNNNKITNSHKYSDYWEMGLQRPDLLLKDLTAIFHPEILKSYDIHWYKKI
jgi:iron complex transport system substrate-binding protein